MLLCALQISRLCHKQLVWDFVHTPCRKLGNSLTLSQSDSWSSFAVSIGLVPAGKYYALRVEISRGSVQVTRQGWLNSDCDAIQISRVQLYTKWSSCSFQRLAVESNKFCTQPIPCPGRQIFKDTSYYTCRRGSGGGRGVGALKSFLIYGPRLPNIH